MPVYAAVMVDVAATSGLILGRFAERTPYAVDRPVGAQSWLLLVTESGHGRVRCAGRETTLERGSVVLLPPRVRHRYGTDDDTWEFWWAHFQMRPEWLAHLPDDVADRGLIANGLAEGVTEDMVETFRRLSAAARWPGHGPIPEPSESEDLALAAPDPGWALSAPQVETLLVLAASQTHAPQLADDRLRRVLALVWADPAAPHSLAGLARSVNLSVSRLSHLSAAVLGRPLMSEVRRLRLEHAAILLTETDLSIARVAEASGFASQFHFSRRFREHAGCPPSEFRSRAAARHMPD